MARLYGLLVLVLLILDVPSSLAAEQQHICRYCSHHASHYAEGDEEHTPGTRRYAPSRYIDLLNLRLDITPDFKQRTLEGIATLQFKPIAKPITELQLDAVDLDIKSVKGSVQVVDYTVSREHLTVTFVRAIAADEVCQIDIVYAAEPRKGLYFRTPEMGYPEEDTHLYTQGEPQMARHWFPSHDYPNERFTSEIICHVPSDMTVLSNGRQIINGIANNVRTVHWKQDKPHANYLITLVAGYFSELRDENRANKVPLAFYSQPTVAEYAKNLFQDTAAIMDFFNEEIGVPFPWDKYYQVTVHDFRFGGMENTSMTTLAHRKIYTEATENIRSGRRLDAHEMAHQWFGDLVTCKDWSHLWLNESFATYYAHLYEGHKFGRDALLYGLYFDATERVLPHHKDRRPIVYNRYRVPIEQFDFRAYPKGSWVLHMLRNQLGESLYREVIRTYLERHAFTSVTTPDLVKVVEELSGRSFDRFFDQWIYHARHPSLKVSYQWLAKKKLAKVTVEQTQKTSDQVLLFEFPTLLRFRVNDQMIDHSIEVTQKKQDFYVSLDAQPTLVRFDPEYTLLADVKFKKSNKLLLAQLENKEDMMGRIFAVKALARKKKKTNLEAVGKILRNDPFFGVQIEAAKALSKVKQDEAFAELQKSIVDSNAVSNARVRLAVVEAIGKFFSSEAEATLLQIVAKEQNPAIVAEATRGLGKYRTPAAQAAITKQLGTSSFRNELAEAAIEAIGKQRDPAMHSTLMQVLDERGEELTSPGLGNGLKQLATISRGLQDDQQRDAVEQFLRNFVEHPKPRVQIAAIVALGELGDSRSQAVLESYADEKDYDPVAQAAAKALKKIQKRAPLVPEELKELREAVTELREQSKKFRVQLEEMKEQGEAAK